MKKKILLTSLLVILLMGLITWVGLPKQTPVDTERVMRGEFDFYVEEDGFTQVKHRYTVSSLVSGNLERLNLKVGDNVKKGQVVARIFYDNAWTMESPIDGRVLKIYKESAGPIERGSPILDLGAVSDIEVLIDLLSTDAVQVKPGMEAILERWGGNEPLSAKVSKIEPAGFTKVSALGVEEQRTYVHLDITSPRQKWASIGDGYKVDSKIFISRKPNVLTVPTAALFRSGPQWYVYKVEAGKTLKTAVSIDARNPQRAALVEGLKEGDVVVVYPSDKLKNGTRVSVKEHSGR